MPGIISGHLWDDVNGDGEYTGNEPYTGTRQVDLYEVIDGVQSVNPIASVKSDNSGFYVFPNVPDGTYRISRQFPTGFAASNDGGKGFYEVTIASEAIVNIGSMKVASQPPTPTPTPTPTPNPTPGTVYPFLGLVGGGTFPSADRKAICQQLGITGTREWANHSDRLTKLPIESDYAGVLDNLTWFVQTFPNGKSVVTNAREGKVDKGKLTRTQSRPAKASDVAAWAKAYWDIMKRFPAKTVIHQLGNEIDHTKQLPNGYGCVYFQADAQPDGSTLPYVEWAIKQYMAMQKVFYDTLKSLGGDDVIVAGPSITWDANNFKLACERYNYHQYCDIGDQHRYARSVDDLKKTAAVSKAAMGGKPLMMSEWGIAHNDKGYPEAKQAELIGKSFPLLAGVVDYAYYYMAPAKDGKVNDPGLWKNGKAVDPIYTAIKNLQKRS